MKQRNAPELLEFFAHTKLCMADWRNAFHIHFDELRPLLKKEIGQVARTYPTEHREIRYAIMARDDRFMGYMHDENVVGWYKDRWFDVEELQLWSIDPDKVAVFLGPKHAPHLADKPEARVSGDFAAITLPSGRHMALARKYKRRAFLRAVAAYCRENGTDVFYAERVIEDHNASLSDRQQKRAISATRVMADLFKGQKAECMELF